MSRLQVTNISRLPLAAAALTAAMIFFGVAAPMLAAPPSGWLAVDGLIRAGGAAVDWANSGITYGTCANGGVDAIGTGGIFNCGRLGAGTNPPIAPTLTAAAAADPSIISADFIVDPVSGDTPTCGPNDPTTLGGGQKNGDAITSYTFGASTVPAKTELANVYAASHTRADNGRPEVYFGAEKLTSNGDTHMDFEFLQSVVSLTAGCTGNFTGNRTQGDLLVAVDFANGGAVPAFSVHQWHCAVDPGPQPADGTICNPAGGPEHYELLGVPPFATLAVNAAAIKCGGWVCRDQDVAPPDTVTVSTNNFLEGGVDLAGLSFAGCFNTFLPHTRTSGAFTATLKDFAGPIAFRSCRNPATTSTSAPSGAGVPAGSSVTDAVTEGNGGAGFTPTGTVTFFLCQPAQVTASGCISGGTQVGPAKTLAAGAATSDPTTATTTAGKYCWRTAYTPDANSTGVFLPATHTNATTECFAVAASGPALPNTGALPGLPEGSVVTPAALLVFPLLLLTLAWRRSRALSALVIAGLVTGASPQSVQPSPATSSLAVQSAEVERAARSFQRDRTPQPATVVTAATPKSPVGAGWRLVIPRIGVDALIEPVGLDAQGAMGSPSRLDNVGWFQRGPSPGQTGDAVMAGHLGLPAQPAVFTSLHRLQPGDTLQVVWPDGRHVQFRVVTSILVSAGARPPDVFARTGPARLSLITCAGAWQQDRSTYTDRLIVTAVRIG